MNIFTMTLALVLLTFNGIASEVTKGHCEHDHSDYFKVEADGTLKIRDENSGFVKTTKEGDTYTFETDYLKRIKQKKSLSFALPKAVVVVDNNNKVQSINSIYPSSHMSWSYEHHFSYRNGKCYHKRYNYQERLYADTDLCRELTSVLEKTPDQFKCNCGSNLAKKLAEILKEHGVDESMATNVAKKHAFTVKKQEYIDSIRYISNCDEFKNMTSAIKDETLWNKNYQKSNNDSQSAVQ